MRLNPSDFSIALQLQIFGGTQFDAYESPGTTRFQADHFRVFRSIYWKSTPNIGSIDYHFGSCLKAPLKSCTCLEVRALPKDQERRRETGNGFGLRRSIKKSFCSTYWWIWQKVMSFSDFPRAQPSSRCNTQLPREHFAARLVQSRS